MCSLAYLYVENTLKKGIVPAVTSLCLFLGVPEPTGEALGSGGLQETCLGNSFLSSPEPILPLRVKLGYPPHFSDGGSEAGRGPCYLALTALTCPQDALGFVASLLPNVTRLSRLSTGPEAG